MNQPPLTLQEDVLMSWHGNLIEDDGAIRQILKSSHVIAVVGAKDESRAHEAAHTVPAYLYSQGYQIIPINPHYKSVFGIPTLDSLEQIIQPVDIVQVFRAPRNVMQHALETLNMKHLPKAFWMQTGIRHQDAARQLAKAGIQVVQDHCMYMDHLRFFRAAA